MPVSIIPKRAGGGGNPLNIIGVEGPATGVCLYQSAAGQYMPGDAGGFFFSLGFYVISVAPPSSYSYGSGVPGASGFHIYNDYPYVYSVLHNSAGKAQYALYTHLASAVGKICLITGVYDAAAGKGRMYRTGIQIGTGVLIAGYTPSGVGTTSFLGGNLNIRTIGSLYGVGIPDATAILAHYNACKVSNTMESMGGGVTNVNRWRAKDNRPAAVSWVGDIGSMVLTKTGTPTSVAFNSPWE